MKCCNVCLRYEILLRTFCLCVLHYTFSFISNMLYDFLCIYTTPSLHINIILENVSLLLLCVRCFLDSCLLASSCLLSFSSSFLVFNVLSQHISHLSLIFFLVLLYFVFLDKLQKKYIIYKKKEKTEIFLDGG
jgi:hypothetical protein